MRRVAKWLWVAVRAPIALLIVAFNVNLWTLSPGDEPLAPTLDALVSDLRNGAGDDMQQLFPEGFAITHAITGFAWVDAALASPAGSDERRHALSQARWLETRVDSAEGRAIFSRTLDPPYGAFYRGYLAWLRGGILRADPDAPAAELAAFQADCEEIAAAMRAANTPYLESYRDAAWPADSVFLAAALSLHDELFEPRYAADISRWTRLVREGLDPALGLIPHSAVPGTGEVLQPPRGVSSVLMSRMLAEIDPELAADQYRKTREHFMDAHLGLFSGVYEYPKGVSGAGDVDSGPLIFGFSLSASVVGIAAARFHGDADYADPTLAGAHAAGVPVFGRYGFSALPVGEAFFAWSKSARPWAKQPRVSSDWDPLLLPGWQFVWHLLSAGVLMLLFSTELRWIWRRAKEKTAP